jgi:hypothetical protein
MFGRICRGALLSLVLILGERLPRGGNWASDRGCSAYNDNKIKDVAIQEQRRPREQGSLGAPNLAPPGIENQIIFPQSSDVGVSRSTVKPPEPCFVYTTQRTKQITDPATCFAFAHRHQHPQAMVRRCATRSSRNIANSIS